MQGVMTPLEIALRETAAQERSQVADPEASSEPQPRPPSPLRRFVSRLRPEWAILVGALVLGA
jgi:hypothetical protein